MPAKLRTANGTVLKIRGRWSSEGDPELAAALNEDLESGTVKYRDAYNPDGDLAEAQRVPAIFGKGEIFDHEPAKYDPGTVY